MAQEYIPKRRQNILGDITIRDQNKRIVQDEGVGPKLYKNVKETHTNIRCKKMKRSLSYPQLPNKKTNCRKIARPHKLNRKPNELLLQNECKIKWEKAHAKKLFQLKKEDRIIAEMQINDMVAALR